jgi:hypothetical protein
MYQEQQIVDKSVERGSQCLGMRDGGIFRDLLLDKRDTGQAVKKVGDLRLFSTYWESWGLTDGHNKKKTD